MAHGDADPVVAFENARASVEVMRNKLGFAEVKTEQVRTLRISATWLINMSNLQVAGPGVRFEVYSGLGHSADPAELEDLTAWLKAIIPEKTE